MGWQARWNARLLQHRGVWAAGLIGAGLVTGVSRNPALFLHPVMGWEDAAQGFDVFVQPGGPVLHDYAGYVSLLPNLVGFLTLKLAPWPAAPFIFAVFALAIAALLPWAFCELFRHVAQLAPVPASLCGVLAAFVPVGDGALISNTEFSIWNMLAVLLLTTQAPLPPRGAAMVSSLGWRACFAASHPLSVLTVVPFSWRACADGRARVACLGLAVVPLAYALVWVRHAPVRASALLACLPAGLELSLERPLDGLIFRGLFRLNGVHLPLMASLAAAAFVWAALLVTHRRHAARRMATLGLLAMALGAGLLSALGRAASLSEAALLASPRYQYLPKLCWLAAMILGGMTLWERNRRPYAATALATVLVLLLTAKGLKPYQADIAQSRQVLAFLRDAARQQRAGAHPALRLPRRDQAGDWSIIVPAWAGPAR